MSSASHSPIATLLGWYFVPNFATSLLLRGFYSFLPSYRPRVPRNPTPDVAAQANARARKHATRAHVLVISTYLLYSLSNAYAGVLSQPNAYALLGLPTRTGEAGQGDEWDAGLKKQWRTLVRVAHPDKTGPAGEARFVAMRSAYETLSHAVKKDAYDRCASFFYYASQLTNFPAQLRTGHCCSMRDEMRQREGFHVRRFAVIGWFLHRFPRLARSLRPLPQARVGFLRA